MRIQRLCAGLAAAATALTFATQSPAGAAPSGDPNVARPATPAHACAAIPATLAQFGLAPTDFSYSSCVRTLAGRVPSVAFGNPYEQCATLEEGIEDEFGFFQITYPYTFHAEPGDPFPNLTAHSREQCARALWTFHTIASQLPDEGD